ncbi:MAG TPA: MATE family efflux transporter [Candidatus Eisenbacteria bacterium]
MTHPVLSLRPSRPAREDFRRLLALALPVVLVQLGIMAMGVAHTMMLGRVSAADLAAGAIGNLYVMTACAIGWGILMALDPIVAQAAGAGDETGLRHGIQRGLLLAVLLSGVTALALAPARAVFVASHQPTEVVPLAARYVALSVPGLLPFFAFIALRQSLQALRRMAPIVATILVANAVNLVLGWMLIFGAAGVPRLGAAGAGVAATLTRWIMALALLALGWRELAPRLRSWDRAALTVRPLVGMLALGLPIGIQLVLEIGVFSVVGLLMGRLGTATVGGHQVAINVASVSYMVPAGVAGAAAVLVGQAIGAGDAPRARRAAAASLVAGAGFMLASGLTLSLAPRAIAGLYTSDPGVIAITARLLLLAAIFQVFDGIQVVGIGVLRGAGDTRVPMLVNLLGYWLLGLPVSLLFGFGLKGGAVGMWWGLVLGLVVVAIVILARVAARLRGELARVPIEARGAPERAPALGEA